MASSKMTMWALTTYFNPIRYKRRLSNYRIFRANLRIPLVTVELSFDGQFELRNEDADVLIQRAGGAILWQKECLLNIAIKSVPSYVKNIAWIDCDILFGRTDWVEDAEKQLNERYNIIQLFSKAIYLNKEDSGQLLYKYNSYPTVPGLIALYCETGILPLDKRAVSTQGEIAYNPGLAWAGKTEIFKKHGFYDLAIIGAGDLYMANSIFGTMDSIIKLHDLNEPRRKSYLQWGQQFHQTVAKRVSYIPGEIYHLWHGDTKNRNYRDRYKILAAFNPQTDVYIGDNGVWQWTNPNSALAEQLRAHFINRREDG
jgi:hypothetical protein